MADDEIQIPVETVADAPISLSVEGENKTETKEGQPDSVQETMDDLRKQVEKSREESRQRLEAADRAIQDAQRRAISAERTVVESRRDAVSATLEAINRDVDAAKRDVKAAQEAGNWDAATEAYDRLATARARSVEIEKGRLALDEMAKNPVQTPPQPSNIDPGEELARMVEQRGDVKAARWLRDHPDIARNRTQVEAAHNFATARGAAPNTDQYFDLVEEAVGLKKPIEAIKQEERPKPPMSAPVHRDSPTISPANRSSNIVNLSRREVDAALSLNLDSKLDPERAEDRQKILQNYARNKLALQNDGKLTA
jgi:hypothetical protein